MFAVFILLLEEYDNVNDEKRKSWIDRLDLSSKAEKSFRDLTGDNERSAVRFYRKRTKHTSCNCLRKSNAKAQKRTKMGKRCSCMTSKEFIALEQCARCSILHYCNRQCQVDHWPDHKEFCSKHRRNDERVIAKHID